MMTDISLTNHFNRANWTPYIALYAALYAKHCQHTPNIANIHQTMIIYLRWRMCTVIGEFVPLGLIFAIIGCHTHETTWMSYT